MERKLTGTQAYDAMFDFIERVYRRTNSDDLASLLGSMSTMADGRPADPALEDDWLKSVDRVMSENEKSRNSAQTFVHPASRTGRGSISCAGKEA
jgi:hypothetical protein